MFSKEEYGCIMENLCTVAEGVDDVRDSVKEKIRKHLTEINFCLPNTKEVKGSVFDWKDLDGKTLDIHIGVDYSSTRDTTVVSGYDAKEDKYYVLHEMVRSVKQ